MKGTRKRKGYLILIVEDLEDARLLRRHYLEMLGYRVVEAEDGEDGIKAALKYSPRLILMNYLMPRMNGLEAVKRMRKIPKLKHVPILMNSACDSKQMREPALAAGCADYLEEPHSFRGLAEKISAHILVG